MLLRSISGFCKLIKYLRHESVKLEVTQSLSSVSATKPSSISVLLILCNKFSAQILSKVLRCWLGQFGKARVKLQTRVVSLVVQMHSSLSCDALSRLFAPPTPVISKFRSSSLLQAVSNSRATEYYSSAPRRT